MASVMKRALDVIRGPFFIFFGIALVTSAAQWGLFRFLAMFCHSSGWWGFLLNPISLGSPVCVAANNVQVALTNHYIAIWSAGVTASVAWLVSNLVYPVAVKEA